MSKRKMKQKSQPSWLLGEKIKIDSRDISDKIAWHDHKIKFVTAYCNGKDVLDIGCVQHNPEYYKSKYWLHKAIVDVASSVDGIDLSESGVSALRQLGYSIYVEDAQEFDLQKKYDVIVAGDIIEHLENLHGFLTSCIKHLRAEGKILISTPNPWYWRNIVKVILHKGIVTNLNQEHTLWQCPAVLKNLVHRHGLKLESWHFGSRYLRDRIMPLPPAIKHAAFHAVIVRA